MPTFLAMANGLHDVVPGDLFSWTTRPCNPMAERLSRHLPHEHLMDPMQHSCMFALSPLCHAFASPSRQPHCPVLTGHLTHALHAHTHTPLTHVHAYMHTTHIAMSSSLLTFTPMSLTWRDLRLHGFTGSSPASASSTVSRTACTTIAAACYDPHNLATMSTRSRTTRPSLCAVACPPPSLPNEQHPHDHRRDHARLGPVRRRALRAQLPCAPR